VLRFVPFIHQMIANDAGAYDLTPYRMRLKT
jgi:hypothetical protein